MSPIKIEVDSESEKTYKHDSSESDKDCKGMPVEDSAEDSIFEEWEDRKTALLAPDKSCGIKFQGRRKRKKRKRKISSSSEEDGPSEKQPRLSRKTVNNAIRLLSRDKAKASTAESRMQKYCKGELSYTTSFDSPTCMLAAIRWCVLTRNWKRMVDLLLIFVQTNRNVMYRKYVKEMCQLVFKLHPANESGDIYAKYKRLSGLK